MLKKQDIAIVTCFSDRKKNTDTNTIDFTWEINMNLSDNSSPFVLIGDVHIGRKFRSRDIPLEMKGVREEVLLVQFNRKVEKAIETCREKNKEGVIILGDLFDSFCVSYDDLIKVYNVVINFAYNYCPCYIIKGNHDQSKDKERISAFDILKRLCKNYDNLRFIEEPRFIGEHLLVPYYSSEELPQVLTNYNHRGYTIYGHFEEADLKWLKLCYQQVFSGHIHSPRQEGNLTVVGSIMPLTFAEDPTNTFMRTCTLAEYEYDLSLGISKGRCYRLKLQEGEELPSRPICLQMSKYIEPKETKEEIDLNVDFEPFDIEKLMHEALDNLNLYEEVYNQYLENKMSEAENV